MKTLIVYLVAMLVIAFIWLLVEHACKKSRRARGIARPFSRLELLGLAGCRAMDCLSVRWHHAMPGGNRIALANAIATRAKERDTKLSAGVIGRRTVVKFGADANHIDVCGVADIPLGITEDGSATEAERYVAFGQFGLLCEEVEATAEAVMADGDMVVVGAAGGTVVRTLPAVTGTYYIIGRCKGGASGAGQPVVFIPCFPIQRVVP